MRMLFAVIALVTVLPGNAAAQSDWRQSVLDWRQERAEGLRQPGSWLSLVGLHWLEEGVNRVGTAPDNDIRLAAGPEHVGRITLDGDGPRFCRAPGADVRIDGEERQCADLVTDTEGEPTQVTFGSVTFHVIDREGNLGLRVKDSQAETLRNFRGLEYFPLDRDWRVRARFVAFDEPRAIEVPDVTGIVQSLPSPGRVVFERNGREYVLDAVRYEGDDEFFLIIADRTNGKQTYGGGRYLYTPLPDAQGNVIVDFNRAYNPPCVFTAYATCPLPPPQNRLDLAIEAGELVYGHED